MGKREDVEINIFFTQNAVAMDVETPSVIPILAYLDGPLVSALNLNAVFPINQEIVGAYIWSHFDGAPKRAERNGHCFLRAPANAVREHSRRIAIAVSLDAPAMKSTQGEGVRPFIWASLNSTEGGWIWVGGASWLPALQAAISFKSVIMLRAETPRTVWLHAIRSHATLPTIG